MKPNQVSFLTLLMQVSLAAPEVSVCPSTASSLNDWSFQARTGNGEDGTSGTLLEELSGVTATGKGVIVGIIDTGIDWRHPDFRNPADTLRSRIIAIWDSEAYVEAEDGQAPLGFGYGREWHREEIEAALRGEGPGAPRDTESLFRYGHGTMVAGIAAGNGSLDPRFRGMAPESEIVVYALGPYKTEETVNASVLDGARYIFDLAERKGMPAVVNFSGRTHLCHQEQEELESLLREMPGRAMVASGGNRGWGLPHARIPLNASPSYTMYQTRQGKEEQGTKLALGGCFLGSGEAWVGAGLSQEEMVWRSLDEVAESEFHEVTDSLGTAKLFWEGSYIEMGVSLRLQIEDTNPNTVKWRIAARGSGVFHTWVWPRRPLDESLLEPLEDPQFRPRDNYYTLSSPSTSPEVISVGAFANRDLDFSDTYAGLFGDPTVGDLMPFSSRGPSLEGLLKPDLVAPGALTAAWSGDSTKYRTEAGTSFSSPVVAGAVALYFQRFPQATNREVWRALTESATSDDFTGETPNLDWGYGKLDVAAFLQEPPTMVAAELWEALPTGFSLAQNYPNPFNGRTTITYELPKPGGVELTLYDLLGQPVRRLVSEYQGAGSYRIAWDGADGEGNQVASGVYLYRLKVGNQQRARRLVLVR